ncbi:MAG: hypothetical protein AOY29_00585 [Alcanivorax borkumensis]|jgi:hypothetical protein|uniref:Uncharacterized protein n=1 Tax=Alcanivorax borkumensis (strain ATCC 700651 / DSM 11573 / NCIMB 13689 / SK2) TaxID=393595 RepID=Q0VRL7_ALCBS|nr:MULTISPECIES: hypothetical protein [Alcanivorax]OJH08579.1 MAG: hypothetical protein AOY29_00585 [Alcanivorax borkumensis]EUC69812.1 hypothetical protein Y017_12920 [Alcanivorax sp. 97CO-5]PKG01650.1 hypothetical protein Y019_07795 [Alcanivorax sp. 97CO-6]CAL16181.1 hypothetical protein ABO_0733 [Alcanivorax borkumensis SK2]BAP13606.1 hypothetical protein AS19_07550 [Alcanivorax sp. NBRC 101098]
MKNVVAIPANPALVNSTEDFIHAVENDRKDSAEKFIEMVDHLTDRVISLLLLEPANRTELSGGQKKVIDFAVSTGSKASSMLTRQIFKKITSKEFSRVLANVKEMYWPAGDDNDNQAYMAFAVDDDFAERFHKATELCAAGKGTEEVSLVIRAMNDVSDKVIDEVFVANTKEVKVGFVSQKALNVGVDGSRKAMHAVNNKVLKDLSDADLKAYMEQYQSLLRQR